MEQAAAAVPDHPAVILGGDTYTFSDVASRGRATAAALAARGVRRGSRVGVWSGPSLDQVPLFQASALLGAAFMPVDPGSPPTAVGSVLDRIGADMLVVDDDHAAVAADLGVEVVDLSSLTRASEVSDADIVWPEVTESDAQAVFLTSGSTGGPKGVVISQRTQWLRSFGGALPDRRGTTVCMFPLFHMAGWLVALQCWQARSPVVLVEKADAETILAAVESTDAERLYAIPAVWRRILDADPQGTRGATLRVIDTGTSATPPELLDALGDRYPGAMRRVFYGSTEAGPVLMLDTEEVDERPGSVGRPQPGVEVRAGRNGELEVRGVHCFDGYLDGGPALDPGRTSDGWYRTGDLAVRDRAGCWSIVGRTRQIIRTGGETVVPAEVEAVIDAVGGVAESAVVGVPDVEWGEVVAAVVVTDPADPATRSDLDSAVEVLAKSKRPRRWEFVAALPRTSATGQIRRPLLVERLASGLPLDGTGS